MLQERLIVICSVVILSGKGRRMALAIGLNVVGTLGLVLLAKNLNLLPSIGSYWAKLREAGSWNHEDLVRRILDES